MSDSLERRSEPGPCYGPGCNHISHRPALAGLQLDLLTAILRLEQIGAELGKHTTAGQDLAEYLLTERVIKCDVPRLRTYLEPDALAFEDRYKAET
jgi:hypothetical protein